MATTSPTNHAIHFAAVAALLLAAASPAAQAQTTDFIDSTDQPGPIDDYTTHSHVVRPALSTGSFLDLLVTRQFSAPIEDIKVTIVDGQADDTGFIGDLQVTNATGCSGVGAVQSPVDVTSEVMLSGDEATLLLRAQENCCCATGWGSAPSSSPRPAKLHWEVELEDESEFEVSFSTFIPATYVVGPPHSFCLTGGYGGRPPMPGPRKNQLYFGGDARSFYPGAESYRARQAVTVVPDSSADPDGLASKEPPQVGETLAFAPDAIEDGTLDESDIDDQLGDCHLLHARGSASTDGMTAEVTRMDEHSVAVSLSGSADNPLVKPSEAIDWDLVLIIDTSGDEPTWQLTGVHNLFPAFEMYVNGEEIYTYSPGTPPYSFTDLLVGLSISKSIVEEGTLK